MIPIFPCPTRGRRGVPFITRCLRLLLLPAIMSLTMPGVVLVPGRIRCLGASVPLRGRGGSSPLTRTPRVIGVPTILYLLPLLLSLLLSLCRAFSHKALQGFRSDRYNQGRVRVSIFVRKPELSGCQTQCVLADANIPITDVIIQDVHLFLLQTSPMLPLMNRVAPAQSSPEHAINAGVIRIDPMPFCKTLQSSPCLRRRCL